MISGIGERALREPLRDARHLHGILVHLAPERRRHGLPREVVVGGSQPARDEDHVSPLQGRAHGEFEVPEVIADDAARDHVDAERGEAVGDHAGVRVDAAEREHLAADGDRLGASKRRRHASIHAGASHASSRTQA